MLSWMPFWLTFWMPFSMRFFSIETGPRQAGRQAGIHYPDSGPLSQGTPPPHRYRQKNEDSLSTRLYYWMSRTRCLVYHMTVWEDFGESFHSTNTSRSGNRWAVQCAACQQTTATGFTTQNSKGGKRWRRKADRRPGAGTLPLPWEIVMRSGGGDESGVLSSLDKT